MWNQKDAMDPGRFILHQAGWDDKSALGRYNPVHNPDFRVTGPYGGRGYTEPGFPGENGFSRGGFHRDVLLERDRYQMAPPVLGAWPPARRSTYEDELGIIRGPQRHAKAGYGDGYRDTNTFRDGEFREATDNYRDANNFREVDKFRDVENFREPDSFRDHEFERGARFLDTERHGFDGDEYSLKRPAVKSSREGSFDRDYAHSRYDDEYDSDHEKEKRDRSWRKPRKRDKEKRKSKDRDASLERGRRRERSRSHGHEHRSRRSRSSSRGYTRDKRERSYEDALYDSYNDRKRTKDEKRHREHHTVAPSATLVVKGLSQRTVEDDIYQALVDWGPLRHVRVIKERTTGTSRGFAFIDFPSVDAARKMMDDVGDNGLVVDGRRLFFEYSSKPTGGVGGPQVDLANSGTTKGGTATVSAVDWMCTVCGCINFARRTSCFQCYEGRTDDAPAADAATMIPSGLGKKGSEAGPTHVLVVRGLDENVNEEILHYEFSKYAPIKDLRLVRDKFTHISKGFAFVHFHSVEDATKALESTNGTTLDKNGQPLRVAYAKSIYGPGSSSSSNTHASNSLAAAAIEAATFAQQYDAVGWTPKEYNPDQEKDGGATGGGLADPNVAPQAGFVWDEASGYYYDAVSGFYYDGHRGLYYDGNNGIWYSYNQETQQYEPYVGQDGETGTTNVTASSMGDTADHQKANTKATASLKTKDGTTSRKAVISAPPATIHIEQDAKLGIAEAVKAAAVAAQATMKKDKARKNLLPSSKTKISGVSAMWKQKQEGVQTAPSDQSPASAPKISLIDDKFKTFPAKATTGTTTTASVTAATVPKKIQGVIHTKQTLNRGASDDASFAADSKYNLPAKSNVVPTSRSGVTTITKKLEGVIHSRDGSAYGIHAVGQGAGNPFGGDYHPSETSLRARQTSSSSVSAGVGLSKNADVTFNKADSSAVVSYGGPVTGGRRRFTETPQSGYRDRAAERRNLHGASLPGDS